MPKFDKKYWNNAIFQKYMKKVPNLREDSLIKSGVLYTNSSLKSRLVDGVGGNTLIEPIKGLIDGDVVYFWRRLYASSTRSWRILPRR